MGEAVNILQAYELAKAGNTVIAPDGTQCRHIDFDRTDMFMHTYVFGEWKEKREPVVLETEVSIANETLYGSGVGMIASRELRSLFGNRVKVTVEVMDDQA